MKNHKILGIITARGGSKGIPEKNIKLLGGKPLIVYTIETARQSALLTHLIVSTDDEKIAAVARAHGAEVPFLRPKELALDTTPHEPVVQHAVRFMEERERLFFDHVVIFQPTSPFRTTEDIDGTIQKLIDTGAESAVSVCEWEGSHPIKAKKMDGERAVPYFGQDEVSAPRQELPLVYKRSGAVYATRRDVIMGGGTLYGDHVAGYIVPQERSVDIDTPLDWIRAEYLLERLREQGFFL